MAVNSSAVSLPFGLDCLFVSPSSSIFIAYTATSVLLLMPLCVLILHHGLQRWRQRCSSSTTASHSDSFTYHLVTMELISVIGCILCCWGIYRNRFPLVMAWYCLLCVSWYGETFFHVVTCVEHYLAVVHPITYLSLRTESGVWIRNVFVGCVWLFCLGGTIPTAIEINTSVVDACLVNSSVVIISFCSLSVLWALNHPGPGGQGRDQRRPAQSKQRAFYTIGTILGALLLRCISNMVWGMFSMLSGGINECACIFGEVWCNFPSSLVLPLLFLHRAGKLMCCNSAMEKASSKGSRSEPQKTLAAER